jgi:hypothetical protein
MSAIDSGSAAIARLMSVAALSIASRSVRAWPSADSAARMESTRPPWPSAGRAMRARALVMLSSAKARRCLAWSTSGVDARGQVDHLLGETVEPAGSVDDQVAELVERVPLRIEFAVGPCRGDDHARQQIAPLLRRFRHGVVEDMANVEGLGQSRLRVGNGGGERRRVLLAELPDGQAQLVVAGACRVVDVDDHRLGQLVERAKRYGCQGLGVRGVDATCCRELGLAALARTPSTPQPKRQQHEPEKGEEGEHADPRDGLGHRLRVQSVGRRNRGARPVVAAQERLNVVRAQCVDVDATSRGVGHQERVRPILGGDREEGIAVLEVVDAYGVSRPRVSAWRRERVDVHDPEPYSTVVVQVVDRRLDLGQSVGGQCIGLIGHVVGQPRGRRPGCGRSQKESGHQGREDEADQTDDAHERQCSDSADLWMPSRRNGQ